MFTFSVVPTIPHASKESILLCQIALVFHFWHPFWSISTPQQVVCVSGQTGIFHANYWRLQQPLNDQSFIYVTAVFLFAISFHAGYCPQLPATLSQPVAEYRLSSSNQWLPGSQ